MDTQPNFEYLCRVCAANTKGKNSVAECVYILKTPSLKDKIEKYLYLTISEDDLLPKVLCKSCFRQVEATASLSKIAKHTQKVFRDFIFSAMPKPKVDVNLESDSKAATEFMPVVLPAKHKEKDRETERKYQQQELASAATTSASASTAPSPSACHKDEVVVNVSVTDPLTRETQQKMISNATQKRQQSGVGVLDARFTPKSIAQRAFTSTPKFAESNSVAVAGAAKRKSNSPPGVINFFHGGSNRPQNVTTLTSGGYVIGRMTSSNSAPIRSSSDAGNALQQKRRNLKMALNNIRAVAQTGQVSLLKVSQRQLQQKMAEQLKLTQSEYVAEAQDDDDYADDEEEGIQCDAASEEEPQLPEKMIIASVKQRRREKEREEENRRERELEKERHKQKEKEKEKERERDREKKRSRDRRSTIDASAAPPVVGVIPTHLLSQHPQELPPKPSSHIPDDITLGKVIKDIDLLKLILKALKWPVTKATQDQQMMRLRNSKFAEIMSDPNLLRDTDLTQLLGPYLAPMLLAAHVLQQQQLAAAAALQQQQQQVQQQNQQQKQGTPSAGVKLTTLQAAQELASAMPYKLPAETSVQLVPASPPKQDERRTPPPLKSDHTKRSHARMLPPKKMRKLSVSQPKERASDLGADEDADSRRPLASLQSDSKSTPDLSNFHIEIDPSFISQYAAGSGVGAGGFAGNDSANEALLALLQRQRAALSRLQRTHRRRQSSSGSSSNNTNIITVPASDLELGFDADDFVLVEPHDAGDASSSSAKSGAVASSQITARRFSTQLPPAVFATPAPVSLPPEQNAMPLITRPIIKRRKTVIQASPARVNLSISAQPPTVNAETVTATSSTGAVVVPKPLPPMPPLQRKPASAIEQVTTTTATQVPSTVIATATQMPSHSDEHVPVRKSPPPPATGATTVSVSAATSATSLSGKAHSRKTSTSKSALGQQLLEAIGLQKVASSGDLLSGSSADKTHQVENSLSRESVQQIRSALKRQLKQAQEQKLQQQQRKQAEPVIQDADSTTKSVVKEVFMEARKQDSGATSTTELDIEEQIDKVALVLQKPGEDLPPSDKEDGPAGPVPTVSSKIPMPRRKAAAVANTRVRKAAAILLDTSYENGELNTIEEVKEDSETKILPGKKADKDSGKEDSESNKLSSSATITVISKVEPGMSFSEPNSVKSNPLAPRKRGRKRKEVVAATAVDAKELSTVYTRERVGEKTRGRPPLRDSERESDTASLKNEGETASIASVSRPTRISKTLSKYYKGPERRISTRRSIPTRNARNRR